MPQAMPEKRVCKLSLYPISHLVLSGMMLILLVAMVTPKMMCEIFFFFVASLLGLTISSLNLIVIASVGLHFQIFRKLFEALNARDSLYN